MKNKKSQHTNNNTTKNTKEFTKQFYVSNKLLLTIATLSTILQSLLMLCTSWILQQLIDTAAQVKGSLSLKKLAGYTLILVASMILVFLLEYYSKPKYIEKAVYQYKTYAYKKLLNKGISSFQDENIATYLSALTNDTNSIEIDYITSQITIIQKSVLFTGALIMMLLYSPLLTGISVLLTFLPVIVSLTVGSKLQNVEKEVSNCNQDFTSSLSDSLNGFSVIKNFKAEDNLMKVFNEHSKTLEHTKFQKNRLLTKISLLSLIAGLTAQLGVFLASTYLATTTNSVTPGVVIVFVNLMNYTIGPITELPALISKKNASLALISKLADELNKNPENEGNIEIDQLNNNIVYNNVSFGYSDDHEILHDISVTFEAGKSYAIVGASGSGKSTMLNLLTNSVNTTNLKGDILIDNNNIKDIKSESLYNMVSTINQKVFIFNTSIRDNITLFSDFNKAEVDNAIRKANIDKLINERGDSYECGEQGKNLSGGEKQRISIARSLLKHSSVLLADEATAALDKQTAFNITNDILNLKDVTRIIVTHSLEESLLKKYDKILVLKDGRIKESGSYDELISNKGYFYSLYTISQAA